MPCLVTRTGISHGLKPPARFFNGLSIPVRQKIKAIRMDGFYFLVNDGVRKTNRKTDTISIYKIGYAAFSGMGISHGLKTCHRHVFLTAFRFPYGKK